MGQVIQLPIRQLFPDHAADLDSAEPVLLTAIRWWVDSYKRNEDPRPRLCQGVGAAGTCDAAFSIDALMALIAQTGQQLIAIHCPHLSDDEKHLLHATNLVQVGDGHLAEKALRTALLSAQGAPVALACLQGLGELFAETGLFLCRRRPPVAHQPSTTAVEAWLPSTLSAMLH